MESYFNENEGGNVWKVYMEGFIIEENDLDHNVEGNTVECTVDCMYRDEVMQTLNVIKTGNVP